MAVKRTAVKAIDAGIGKKETVEERTARGAGHGPNGKGTGGRRAGDEK